MSFFKDYSIDIKSLELRLERLERNEAFLRNYFNGASDRLRKLEANACASPKANFNFTNVLLSNLQRINCVEGTGSDKPTRLTSKDFDTVCKSLIESKPEAWKANLSFFAIFPPQLKDDIKCFPGFIPLHYYPAHSLSFRQVGELGCVGPFRFLEGNPEQVSPKASLMGNDVYNIICVLTNYNDLAGTCLGTINLRAIR